MDLHRGVCGICNSENLILSSKDSEKYNKLMLNHFIDELDNIIEADKTFSLCPKCVHHITLLDFKKDLLLNKDKIENSECGDKCKLCLDALDVLSIHDAAILENCRYFIPCEEHLTLCASCFYLIDVRNTLKSYLNEKLTQKQNLHANIGLEGMISQKKSFVKRNNKHEKSEENYDNVTSDFSSCTSRRKGLQPNIYTKDDLEKFTFSNTMKFLSLCNSNIDIAENFKHDGKLYNYIPFVKIEITNETSAETQCNYTCSLEPQRAMIRVKRTPPIKIKTIKNIFSSKKNRIHEQKKNEKKTKTHLVKKISKKDLIVKVERMKLPLEMDSSTYESDELMKKRVSTKKKKHVHFNDTPTIIVSENTYGDDHKEKKIESNKNHIPQSIMVTDKVVNETTDLSEDEESLVLSLQLDGEEEQNLNDEDKPPIDNDNSETNSSEYDKDNETDTVEKEMTSLEREILEVETRREKEDKIETDGSEIAYEEENRTETTPSIVGSDTEDAENVSPEKNDYDETNTNNQEEIITEENTSETSASEVIQNNSECDEDSDETPNVKESEEALEENEKDIEIETKDFKGYTDNEDDNQFDIETLDIDKSIKKISDAIEGSKFQSAEHVTDSNEVCNNEEEDNDEDSEGRNSLEGFQVVDQEDESSETEEKNRELEKEMDQLLQKYCDDDSNNEEKNIQENEEPNILENEEPNIQENEENIDEKSPEVEEQNEELVEDFGSLIDEVQECLLTASTDDADVDGKITQNEIDIKESHAELLGILEDSFDDALPKDKENNKRKYSKDESDEECNKKTKLDNL